jgi:hypothetical protein
LQHKLPNLTYDRDREQTDPGQHFDVLVASDAFQIGATVARDDVQDQFGTACADIVVGNPPWGDPQSPDLLVTAGKRGAMAWCRKNQRAVGDRELSQAFIHRTLDLLRDGGRAGLLVSTGVFFKGHKNSQQFRRQWLSAISLQHVVNFAAVRDTFFRGPSHRHRPRRGAAGILQDAVFTESARNEGSIAPFASVIFEKTPAPNNQRFAYWSAKKTSFIERVQVVVLSRADVHVVRQDRMIADDELWKVYWWGSHRDEALIEALRINPTLRQIVGPDAPGAPRFGRGYEKTKKGKVPSDWLAEYKELPSSKLTRYGPITPSMLVPVSGTVYRRGNRTVYDGTRLIIRRGISQRGTSKGRIIARLATEPFCFLNSVHGVRLYDHAEGDAEVLLGIVWSSLIRYFAFMTCGSWGPWHHEIHLEDLERLPIRIPSDPRLRQRISETVSALRAINAEEFGLLHPEKHSQEAIEDRIRGLEAELDAAIFDLFELDDAERDLVYDLCTAGLDLFYRGMESAAFNAVLTEPAHLVGRKNDIDHTFRRWKILRDYIHAFLDVLERNLPKDSAEFYFRAVRPDDVSPMLAMIFSVENADEPPAESITSLEDAWAFAVALVASASLQPFHAQRIYIDGMTRIVTETDIAIIKRNELRLWTRSAAREDAEATLHQILRRQHATKIGEVRSAHA